MSAGLPSPGRVLALEVLARAMEPHGPGVDVLLAEGAAKRRMDARDAGLARELACGVLRHRLALEDTLGRYLRAPIVGFAPRVHESLLLAFYQLQYLDRIPPHAVVSETVDLAARQPGGAKLKGLVNAVLRRATREGIRPPTESDPWRECSVPDFLRGLLVDVYGEDEALAFARASNEPAPLCLRARRPGALDDLRAALAEHAPDATLAPGRLVSECAIVTGRGVSPESLPGFASGDLTAEDEGAQAVCLIAAAGITPTSILDLCASPGGKTAHLADMFPDARLTACDVTPAKMLRLEQTLARLGLADRVATHLHDATAREGLEPGTHDLVLVDAPCSGYGTLRRHPEIRYRRRAEDIENLARLQSTLLARAAEATAPGGVLVYSVCTITRAEAERVVDQFLVLHPDFTPDEPATVAGLDAAALCTAPAQWRTAPHLHACDGFFIARMRRTPDC